MAQKVKPFDAYPKGHAMREQSCGIVNLTLLVRLKNSPTKYSREGDVGFLQILETSRFGTVISAVFRHIDEDGAIIGAGGEVINPEFEQLEHYNGA